MFYLKTYTNDTMYYFNSLSQKLTKEIKAVIYTNNVLGDMFARYFNWLAEPDFVDSSDTTLVLCFVDEILNDIACLLQVPGNVEADPVSGVIPLAFHQVSNDRAPAVVSRCGPGETDGAVGSVSYTRVHNRSRRSCRRTQYRACDVWQYLRKVSTKFSDINDTWTH